MELSPIQRFAAFVVVVLVLAGLGAYLFLPRSSAASGRHAGAPHRCAHSASARRCARPAPTPLARSTVPFGPAAPHIYQWLPLTQAALSSAARATTTFAQH